MINGPNKWPGAMFYLSNKEGSVRKFLKFAKRDELAKFIKTGQYVAGFLLQCLSGFGILDWESFSLITSLSLQFNHLPFPAV